MTSTSDLQRSEPAAEPRSFDPEFHALAPRTPDYLDRSFEAYQRLVANPFLALFALIPWGIAFRWAFLARSLEGLGALLIGLGLILCLLQFHCRDCGKTGSLIRWRSHVCERAIARQRAGRYRSFRGPNPTTQTLLWGYAIVVAALLARIALGAHR
jgi:hypothetical protein